MGADRCTRPLRFALIAVALASPAALTLGVRRGHLEAPQALTMGELPGLAATLGLLLLALAALCAVAHVLDTRSARRGDTR